MNETLAKDRHKGFTLIELMIVVAIIGIMSAISIPNFLKFQCKAKQSEARATLKGIFTVESIYGFNYGSFLDLAELTTFGGLDNRTVTGARYYRFSATGGAVWNANAADSKQKVNSSSVSNDSWDISAFTLGPRNTINSCQ
jgi:type IV pilus assembly protein PilA